MMSESKRLLEGSREMVIMNMYRAVNQPLVHHENWDVVRTDVLDATGFDVGPPFAIREMTKEFSLKNCNKILEYFKFRQLLGH